MALLGLVWNTRPGACEDDPPGAGNGPWSTRVMSSHPRADSSSTSAAPTTPAPTTTTRGPAIPTSMMHDSQQHAGYATQRRSRSGRCQERRRTPSAPGKASFVAGGPSGLRQPGLDLVLVGVDPLLRRSVR